MLDELIQSIVEESVKQTLQQLGTLDKIKQDVPDTMTTQQLADYMGMSVQWVYEHTKELPHEKRGRKTLFIRSEIDQWRENQREKKGFKKVKQVTIKTKANKRGLYKIV